MRRQQNIPYTSKCNTSESGIFSVTTDLAEALQEFAPRFNLRITNKCDVDSTNIKIYNYPWRLECGCACIPWSLSKHHRLPLRACYAAVKLNAYTTCFLILLSKSKRAEIFILRRLNEQQSYGADQASGIFYFASLEWAAALWCRYRRCCDNMVNEVSKNSGQPPTSFNS